MAIKLKNNHKTKLIIGAWAVLFVSVLNLIFIPLIQGRAETLLEQETENNSQNTNVSMNENGVQDLYRGLYVLYLEANQEQSTDRMDAASLLLDTDSFSEQWLSGQGETAEEAKNEIDKAEASQAFNDAISEWKQQFYESYPYVDVCYELLPDGAVSSNTDRPLKSLLNGAEPDKKTLEELQRQYAVYMVISFDEKGIMSIENVYGKNMSGDAIIKAVQLERGTQESILTNEIPYEVGKITSFTVAYGISTDNEERFLNLSEDGGPVSYQKTLETYEDAGADILFGASLVLLVLTVILITEGRFWKEKTDFSRPGKYYVAELAAIGVIVTFGLIENWIGFISEEQAIRAYQELLSGTIVGYDLLIVLRLLLFLILVYGIWFLSVYFIRPVVALGVSSYIKEYSLIYQMFPWLKKKWKEFYEEISHVDFKEKSTKTMIKVVVLNFAVILLISCLWFFGIWVAIIYSLVLFYFLNRYYDTVRANYNTMLKAVSQIAEGNLDAEITEDMGVFEPFKEELVKVQDGFKNAVEQETKSQRMKTELITNVSHDLKTPLTAITTYVELLKKEDITEEERRSYIDTLEKKSLRLKVLIEDLFEVSKATSNNIVLHPMDVDVVNLMKQVSVEHTSQYEELGLDLRFHVPEEKVVLQLDNQKTYRIFENLFVNIQKYAMPNSRVYVDVSVEGDMVRIVLKNMSKNPIDFSADEITERFVRGDASRNTEGSGLGLAIAKSFTEAQKGDFKVDVDGDLFKVTIFFCRENRINA